MRFELRVDPGLVSLTVHGVLTAEDVRDVRRKLWGDPSFSSDSDQMIDARDITSVELTMDEIVGLADTDPFARSSRRAFVVSSDVMYGVFHQYMVFAERKDAPVRLFRGLDEALTWLGREASGLEPTSADA